MLQVVVEKSMTCLMICSCSLFIFCHEDTLLCDPKQYLVSCFFEILHIDNGLIASCCKKRSFVDKVSQICATCSRSSSCDSRQVHVFCKLDFSCMYTKYIQSFLNIRKSDSNLSIESTRSQESRIQYIRSVGGGNDNYTRIS